MARTSRNKSVQLGMINATKNSYKTAIYLRLSVNDNSIENKTCIENQRYMMERYIEERAYLQLVDIYEDNGKSGTNFERPEFSRLMEDIREKKINCIVVKDLSRFGRNFIETGNYLEKIFPFLNVRFIAVNDNYDSADPNCNKEEIIIAFKNLMNEVYAKDISKKVSVAFESKKERGEFLGGLPPYGYFVSKEGIGKLEIDKEAAVIVKQIFQWACEGDTKLGIAKRLTEMKIHPPRRHYYEIGIASSQRFATQTHWNLTAITTILSNPVYLGHMLQGKTKCSLYDNVSWHQVESDRWSGKLDTHEAIIDEETFDKASKLIEVRRKKYKGYIDNAKVERNTSLVHGKITCGDCGKRMPRHSYFLADNTRRYYYYCSTHEVYKECSLKCMYEDELYFALYETIRGQVNLVDDLEKKILKYRRCKETGDKKSNIQKEITEKRKALQRILLLRNSLYEDYNSDLLTNEEYIYAKNKYTSEYEKLTEELEAACYKEKALLETSSKDKSLVSEIKTLYNERELTQRMIAGLIQRVKVYDGNRIEIELYYQDEFKVLLDTLVGGMNT